jgi:hypothetical protein
MTKAQAAQLGQALILWSNGASLEARDSLGEDQTWYPFCPEDYEKISVILGIEWKRANQPSLPSSKRNRQRPEIIP